MNVNIMGVPVHFDPNMNDGQILYGQGWIIVGTYVSAEERRKRAYRLQVREMMADVLEWLGEPVNVWPIHEELLARIKHKALGGSLL